MSESFISFQTLSFVIIQLAFLLYTVGWNWNGSDKELLHLHLWQTDHICSYISQHPVTPSKEDDGLAMQSTIINTWKKTPCQVFVQIGDKQNLEQQETF